MDFSLVKETRSDIIKFNFRSKIKIKKVKPCKYLFNISRKVGPLILPRNTDYRQKNIKEKEKHRPQKFTGSAFFIESNNDRFQRYSVMPMFWGEHKSSLPLHFCVGENKFHFVRENRKVFIFFKVFYFIFLMMVLCDTRNCGWYFSALNYLKKNAENNKYYRMKLAIKCTYCIHLLPRLLNNKILTLISTFCSILPKQHQIVVICPIGNIRGRICIHPFGLKGLV